MKKRKTPKEMCIIFDTNVLVRIPNDKNDTLDVMGIIAHAMNFLMSFASDLRNRRKKMNLIIDKQVLYELYSIIKRRSHSTSMESFERLYHRLQYKKDFGGDKVRVVSLEITEESVDRKYREYLREFGEKDKADAIILKISCSDDCHLLTKEKRLCEVLDKICRDQNKEPKCMYLDDNDLHNDLREKLKLIIIEDP